MEEPYLLHLGDCLGVLKTLPANSIDACVTDPPAGIAFMGKSWDRDKGGRDAWIAWMTEVARECLRVLKPGGHALVWAIPRTSHWTATAWENAGFEVRDRIAHLHGQGFPKSSNQGGAWDGWGTALKPACEDWWLLRKPLESTVAASLATHGTGALNIDGCRIQGAKGAGVWGSSNKACQDGRTFNASPDGEDYRSEPHQAGRWPANVTHDGSDEVVSLFPSEAGAAAPVHRRRADKFRPAYGAIKGDIDEQGSTFHGDSGSAARFYYCAKATRADREEGCEAFDERPLLWSSGTQSPGTFQSDGTKRAARNNHPTVKPVALMRWLCRLVTQPGGTILDPFMGSGSTGKAAMLEGFRFIGIEQDAGYLKIAEARITRALALANGPERLVLTGDMGQS